MNKHSIEKDFYELNLEYLMILKKSKTMLAEQFDSKIIIDGIVNFWNRKRKKADHIISIFGNSSGKTLFFTGVSTMNVDSGEAIPFLMSGKRFVYDDPICVRIQLLSVPVIDMEKLKKELLYEIEDEIKIIELYGERISVLPIRYYYHPNEKDINKTLDSLFLDLFDRKFKTLGDFFENNNTLVDIEQNINKAKIQTIMFTNDEEEEDPLETRINKFDTSLLADDLDFCHKFYFVVFSVLLQSLIIVYSSFACGFAPYLRNGVCLINTLHFWRQYNKTEYKTIVLAILKKSVYSYALYKTLNRGNKIAKNGFLLNDDEISSFFNYFDGCDDTDDIEKVSLNKALGIASCFCEKNNLDKYE